MVASGRPGTRPKPHPVFRHKKSPLPGAGNGLFSRYGIKLRHYPASGSWKHTTTSTMLMSPIIVQILLCMVLSWFLDECDGAFLTVGMGFVKGVCALFHPTAANLPIERCSAGPCRGHRTVVRSTVSFSLEAFAQRGLTERDSGRVVGYSSAGLEHRSGRMGASGKGSFLVGGAHPTRTSIPARSQV